jgi:hypothetical protein
MVISCTVEPAYKDVIQTSDLARRLETFIENAAYKNTCSMRTLFPYKQKLNSSSVSIILIKLYSKYILVGRLDCSGMKGDNYRDSRYWAPLHLVNNDLVFTVPAF